MSEIDVGLERILAPTVELLEETMRKIATAETLLVGLRADERRLERVLRAADPNRPGQGRKLDRKSTDPINPKARAAQATVERIAEYLSEHADRYRNGDGFTGTSLYRDIHADKAFQISSATISIALHQLREQELIRLSKRGTGGSRIYRLV